MRVFWPAVAFTAAALPAMAGTPALIATNMPGVAAIAPPPAGFDPLRASQDELETYGFPPRPSPVYRTAYAFWASAMHSARIRIVPVLRDTGFVEGPARHVAAPALPGTLYSKNWSGFVTINGAGGFGGSSITQVSGQFVVPIAEPPFGACGTGYHASSWVGIDGWQNNSPDVLQAGTESDDYCTGGSNQAFYFPWFEWYPANQMQITNLAVGPGDVINVFVKANSATSGFALVQNATTNQYVTVNISPPGGTQLVGSSAEWIVERPSFNNNLSNLANYVTTWISNTGAAIGNAWFNYATPPGGNTPYNVVMVDNGGAPLSVPTGLYPNGMVLNTTGSAR